jgi:hypothetical protein
MKRSAVCVVLSLVVVGCGEDEDSKTCSLADPVASCGSKGDSVCEDVAGTPTCVMPLLAQGRVLDQAGAGIAGAQVTALDVNDAPFTGTAVSGNDGAYQLLVRSPRAADGTPLVQSIKLRASGAGFENFPGGLRRSLPLSLTEAAVTDGRRVLQNSATDLVLFRLASTTGLGTISGTVQGEPGKRGVLVVAHGSVALSSVSDVDGAYTLFNVPAGDYEIRGYVAGVQLQPVSVTVGAAAKLTGANLTVRQAPLGSVAGSVSMVNAPGDAATSVVLVVADTFNAAFNRGEVPPGLRTPRTGVPDVAGAFTVGDVPDGKYKVLAAFENDGLVRDPDPGISGTQIQTVELNDANRQVMLAAGFKITEALQVMHPGASDTPEPVTGVPTFTWKDDSSEDRYAVELIDARGNLVWTKDIGGVSAGNVSVSYDGSTPLAKGTLYQFRATSFRKGGTLPISQTEDLRGVFLAQ